MFQLRSAVALPWLALLLFSTPAKAAEVLPNLKDAVNNLCYGMQADSATGGQHADKAANHFAVRFSGAETGIEAGQGARARLSVVGNGWGAAGNWAPKQQLMAAGGAPFDEFGSSEAVFTLSSGGSPSAQTITFNAIAGQTVGGLVTLGATASSGLPVSYTSSTAGVCTVSGSAVSLLAAGTCTITAAQPGDGVTYAAATPVTQSFAVSGGLATQTITFSAIPDQFVGVPITKGATATSGLPVTLTSSTPSVCTVSGETLSFVAAGTCTVTASQAGDGVSFVAAVSVTQSFLVTTQSSLTGIFQKLLASDGALGDHFAQSGAISGDGNTALVGALEHNSLAGAAYIFVRTSGGWSQQQELSIPGTVGFGGSCALSGDGITAVVEGYDTNASVAALYVFKNVGGSWTLQQELTVPTAALLNSNPDGTFSLVGGTVKYGQTFKLSGDGSTIVLGAPAVNSNTGAVYVYAITGGVWGQQQVLTAFDGVAGDQFGDSTAVSTDGNTAVLGAAYKDSTAGAAYVFTRSNGVWSLQQELTAPSPAGGDYFGSAAISGDGSTVLLAASNANGGRGTAYVFTRSGTNWTLQQQLNAGDGLPQDYFGDSEALSSNGNTALVGGNGRNSFSGEAWVFTRTGGTWSQQQELSPTDTYGHFGDVVALSNDGTTALVGAAFSTISSISGEAYVYTLQAPLAAQTITFNTVGGQTVGGSLTLGATASSGLPVSYTSSTAGVCTVSGSAVSLLAAGTCTITAAQPGDGVTYAAATPVTQSFAVSGGLATQTIIFSAIPDQCVGVPITKDATATSGLPVTLTSSTPSVCTVSGETLSFVAAGTCTVTASQAGDSVSFAAAVSVTQSFLVTTQSSLTDAFQKLLASDGAQGDFFASTVALSADGNTALVGGRNHNSNAGAAYIFVRSSGAWNQVQELSVSGTSGFGFKVSLSGDGSTAAVQGFDTNAGVEAVYVFTGTGGIWSQQQELMIPSAPEGDGVAVLSGDGNTLLELVPVVNSNMGAAYVYIRSAGSWSQQQVLTASDGSAGDEFGWSGVLSNDGNTALIGALNKNSSVGAVYVFGRVSGSWSLEAELTATDGAINDLFGSSVALSTDGSTALVGAQGKNSYTGAAYVFTKAGGSWGQQQELSAADAAGSDLGSTVALSSTGNAALVGGVGKNNGNGGAWVFARTGSAWSLQQELNPTDTDGNYAEALALSGDGLTALVGEFSANQAEGEAYVYTLQAPLAAQTITFNTVGGQTVGGSLTLGATASSGLPVSYTSSTAGVCTVSGSAVSLLAAGTCTITAAQPGDGVTYAAATPVTQSFAVSAGSAAQAVTFGLIGTQQVGTLLTLDAVASSGLPVSFSSTSSSNVCTVSGNIATLSSTGACTIVALQSGNATYAAAPSVTQSFTVVAATSSLVYASTQTVVARSPNYISYSGSAAADAAGDVFIADTFKNRVLELPAGGGAPTTIGSGLVTPYGLALDAAGDVFIADTGNSRVVEVPAGGGAQTTIGSGLVSPRFVAVDAAGDVFIVDTFNNQVVEVPAGGGAQTTVGSGLSTVYGVAADAAGDVFIADLGNSRVVKVPAGGGAQTTVGTGWLGPFGVAVDAAGDVFVSDESGQVVEVPAGGGTQIAIASSTVSVLSVDAAGNVFLSKGASGVEKLQRTTPNFQSANVCASGQTTPDPCSQAASVNYTVNANVTVGSVSIVSNGAASSDFTVAAGGTCSGGLSAGGSCAVNVTFAPTAAGLRTATLQILDGSGSVLVSTPLMGTGVAAGTAVTVGTNVPGLAYTVDGVPYSSSQTFTWNIGSAHSIATTTPQTSADGTQYAFTQWSDGTTSTTDTVTASAGVKSYLANFQALTRQTISFGTIATQQVDTPLALVASASSGLPVSFASTLTTSNVCIVSGNTVTFSAAGTCTIVASQAGNGTYAAAPIVAQSFTVTVPQPQAITFAALAAQTVGTPLSLAASASSGLPVSFNASPANVCDVQVNTSTGAYTAVFSAIGSCTLTASQAGNSTYAPAAAVSQIVTVNGEAQTITASSISTQTEGTTLSLENYFAASSSLALTFAGSGDCTVNGNSVTFGANAGTCTITASQAGDGQTYAAAANVQQTIAVQAVASSGSSQTIASSTTCSTAGVAYDSAGNAYIAYAGTGCGYVTELPANGGETKTIISGLTNPAGLSVDRVGDVFVADSGAGDVVELPVNGTQSVILTGLTAPTFISVNPAGTLLFITEPTIGTVVEAPLTQSTARFRSGPVQLVPVRLSRSARLVRVSSSNGFFSLITGLTNPGQYGQDSEGNGYVVNNVGSSASQVLKLPNAAAQTSTTTASSLAVLATVPNAAGGLVPSNTGVVINQNTGSSGGAVVAVSTVDGSISTVASTNTTSTYLAVAQTSSGSVNTLTSSASAVVQTTQASAVNFGSVNVTQTQSATVRFNLGASEKLAASAPIKVTGVDFASTAGTCTAGLTNATSCTVTVIFKPVTAGLRKGAVQLTDSNGNVITTYIYGVGVAPLAAFAMAPQNWLYANTGSVKGVAIDGAGDLFFVDTTNNQVFEIAAGATAPTALLKTPTGLSGPTGIAVDGAGNVFVADTGNNRVVQVLGGAAVAYVASGASISGTALNAPGGLATDGVGNLYIADSGNGRIVQVSPAGMASVAATGFTAPLGVAVDAGANLYVAGSGSVTKVAASSGTQSAVGSGFTRATSVALDAAGDVYVADGSLNTVTEVTASGQTTIVSSLTTPYGLAIDGAGDVFIANAGASGKTGSILQLERAQALPLSFATTLEGNTSTDSPKTETVINVGNATLTASALTVSANFAQVTGNATDCSATSTLAPGESCNVRLSFAPAASGALSGTAVLTDNSLNGGSVSQTISLSGTGQSPLQAQAITFNPIGAQTAATTLTLSATASSGLAVTYTSGTPAVCTVSGSSASLLVAGTCTVTAAQSGNSSYAAAVSVTQSFTVGLHSQTINFGTIAAQTAATTLPLTGTASSGLAVAYTSSTPTVCTVAGSTATLLASGTCTVVAAQAGNTAYSAAASVKQSFTVNKHSQTISFAAISTQAVGTPLTLGATASSGLAVSYSAVPALVCSVSSNGIATFTGLGLCIITAQQPGNGAYATATPVVQSFLVTNSQTIAFSAIPAQTAATTLTLTASASSGLPVSYLSATASVCTVNGSKASLLTAGTCTITASQAGNAVYAPAKAVTQSFTVNLHPQVITFGAIGAQTAATNLALTATASSGLGVTYASSTPAVCSVANSAVSLLISGTCTLVAAQSGNGTYAAASPVSQSFTVNKHTQTITFGSIGTQLVGTPLLLGATASSGLAVTYAATPSTVCAISGSTATFSGSGTCTITASQAGNGTYSAAASVAESFSVLRAQTITFGAIAGQTAATKLSLTATASSGLAVSFASATPTVCAVSGSSASLLIAGTCKITASQAGNATYAAAQPVSQSFSVALHSQTITFGAIATQTVGTPLTLSASANSGLGVTYSATPASVCKVSGSTASFTAAGSCTITASQAGNATYAAATPVAETVTVKK